MENVRQRLILAEKDNLSPYAQLAMNTKGRKRREEECTLRTCYQKDRDKILHSTSFRRLKRKTQVFIAPEGDLFRTRLTHTLEVTQIARTIARALNLNEDLTEAIGLGHDLGHTPFGHAGERALNSLNPDGFAHYEQSLRVVDYLERDLKGLNLTYEVRDGILNHTKGKMPCTLEGVIVRYADRIAYINHDIEDAVSAGLLTEADLPEDCTAYLGHSKSERITSLITSMVENSHGEIKMDDKTFGYFEKLREFMYKTVYTNNVVAVEEQKVYKLIEELYKYYYNNIDKMPEIYGMIAKNEGKHRAVTDYIQGMSDLTARSAFEEIFIPKPWKSK